MTRVPLPPSIRVLERGWLSANNVLLFDGGEAILVDSGYVSHAGQTVALLREALTGRRLTGLLNTHSHSDHIGGNAAVQRAFGCTIGVPAGIGPAVAGWDEVALLLSVADQQGERFGADHLVARGALPWARGAGSLVVDARGLEAGIPLTGLQATLRGAVERLQVDANAQSEYGTVALRGDAARNGTLTIHADDPAIQVTPLEPALPQRSKRGS